MPGLLVEMVREYEKPDQDERRGDTGKVLLEKIRTAGRTAAFFGGFDGMKQLHDAAEALVANDNSVGYWLNRMWDGIGGWWA
ncbi:MAG: hypothetical protein AB1768_19955 [Pseudomonadota bacterium]